VIGLVGELGGGKTTFVQGLAEGLGVVERIISPTFIIVRQYSNKLGGNLYHIDLYRLEGNIKKELETLGVTNFMEDNKNVVIIEWADKAKELLPESTRWVAFENVGENERKIIL